MTSMGSDQLKLFQMFFPRAFASYLKVATNRTRFVQYTRAESAINMLRGKSVWLRKPQWMNDYLEIEHGLECLVRTFGSTTAGKRFRDAMDSIFPEISKKIAEGFDPWIQHYRLNTFVACVSEHDSSEDAKGRLSMWRAYGGGTGVALVVKSEPFVLTSDALGAYSSPVAYTGQADVEQHFDAVAAAIEKDKDFVKSRGQVAIENMIHEAFRFGMICNKHPGFAEEREWRIVYNPDRDTKKVLTKSIQVIGGVPQPVYSIPLTNIPGYTDLSVAALLDRIIIGPTQFPGALLEAFRAELEELHVPNIEKKVVVSDIPLRT